MTTRRSLLMSSLFATGLAGCGFELRKAPNYAFSTLYSTIPAVSPFGAKLKRSLESSGQVEVINDPRQIERAQVIFDQLFELRERRRVRFANFSCVFAIVFAYAPATASS
jgi:LPS-assembly lipoprotein